MWNRKEKNDYNIFVEGGSSHVAVATLKRFPIYPIRTHDTFDHDPLRVLLNAFSKIEKEGGGAALQFLVRPRAGDYQRTYEETHASTLRKGEKRVLVMNLHAQATREEAFAVGRNGHDEFCRFLAPYGRFTSYKDENGQKFAFGRQPTLEQSVDQQIQLVDSVENVAEALRMYVDRFGIEHFVFFLDLPGLTRSQIDDQIHILTEQVLPAAGIVLEPLAPPTLDIPYRVR